MEHVVRHVGKYFAAAAVATAAVIAYGASAVGNVIADIGAGARSAGGKSANAAALAWVEGVD